MNTPHIPLPIIEVPTTDPKIPVFNRFYLPRIKTDHRTPLDSLLASAKCQTGAWENACKLYSNVPDHPGYKRFILVRYEPDGIDREEVLRSFEDGDIRPATLKEMLAVTTQHLESYGISRVIALGSSNINSPELSRSSQGLLYRLCNTRKMHLRWLKSIETFPLMDWRKEYSHLHLTEGVGGWKSRCVFLGVVLNREFDTRLVDMKISIADYRALPRHDFYPNLEHAAMGSRYVAESGYICKVVRNDEIFPKQFGQRLIPLPKNIGLQYYRPVFTDI
ncbi:MAG: hypothetical protein KBB54_03565 [Candidatus Pacebacteria bacterium]|nr:hypothetical protein [Candidatus Paceibacterota bacterium]